MDQSNRGDVCHSMWFVDAEGLAVNGGGADLTSAPRFPASCAVLNGPQTRFHKSCAKCADCSTQITLSNFTKSSDNTLLCKVHVSWVTLKGVIVGQVGLVLRLSRVLLSFS